MDSMKYDFNGICNTWRISENSVILTCKCAREIEVSMERISPSGYISGGVPCPNCKNFHFVRLDKYAEFTERKEP